MDSQALAIAIDRLKFYAKDAAFTLSQVSLYSEHDGHSANVLVYLQTVRHTCRVRNVLTAVTRR